MIEDPPLLTLRRNFPRPTPEALAALTGLPTGYLVDAQSGRGALDHRIKPLDGTAGGLNAFCATAVTCRTRLVWNRRYDSWSWANGQSERRLGSM